MDNQKTEIIASLFSGKKRLPTMPSIFLNFTKLVNNPATSARKVADLIMKDQAMVVKILRLCNSAIYGRMKETTRLTDAINFLGMDNLRRITLQLSLIKMFKLKSSGLPEFSVSTFWEHSIATAHFAEALARRLRLPHSDHYYLGGLLHDIGKVLVYEYYPKQFVEIVSLQMRDGMADFDAERQVLQVDHCDIGAYVTEEWKFNRELIQAIRQHHTRLKPQGSKTAAVVTLANLLARVGNFTFAWDNQDVDILGNPAWQLLLPERGGVDAEEIVFALMNETETIHQIVREFVW